MAADQQRDSDERRTRLVDLVAQLPEIYQPIYGEPRIEASRSSDPQRVETVLGTIQRIADTAERPLRILDLGSAQGFVAFRIAERGHHVTGIESLQANLAVANEILQHYPELDVSFIEGDVMGINDLVDVTNFDVVLGLSVLHHLLHRDGRPRVSELLSLFAARIPFGVFEMALASEPVYWASALPQDPRVTLAPYPFLREVGRARTHLSDVSRPLLVTSSTHALVNDRFEVIESWSDSPHDAADAESFGLRRYFNVPSGIVKIVARFDDAASDVVIEHCRDELRNEAQMLTSLPSMGIEVPTLLEFEDSADETVIVRTRYPGELLSVVVAELSEDDRTDITTQVLTSLAALEAQGLFHADLRLWNVLWDGESRTARLIDFGALSGLPGDTMWPFDAYFSFMIWLVSLWSSHQDQNGLRYIRAGRLSQVGLPESIRTLIEVLMTQTRDEHVFRQISARWTNGEFTDVNDAVLREPVVWRWFDELEKYCSETERSLLDARLALESVRSLDTEITSVGIDQDAWSEQRAHLMQRCEQLQQSQMDLEAELARTRATLSWRVTRPLRGIRSVLKSKRR